MRMNVRNVAILVIILTFVFVYTIHVNWKQKKEIAAYSHETEVYGKHIDELTAKLNECSERKQQWGIKFENAKEQVAKLQTALNAARSLASKSAAESSDKARQSSERLSDLEGQVKQLTELRSGLEQEVSNLRKQLQERLSNDSDALTLLHKQLDKALANEKILLQRIDTLESLTKSLSEKTTNTVDATTLNSSSTSSSANLNSTTSLATSSLANSSSAANPTKSTSIAEKSASSIASEELAQAKMVLRPPNKDHLNKSIDDAKLQQGDHPAAAAAAPGAAAEDAPAAVM